MRPELENKLKKDALVKGGLSDPGSEARIASQNYPTLREGDSLLLIPPYECVHGSWAALEEGTHKARTSVRQSRGIIGGAHSQELSLQGHHPENKYPYILFPTCFAE